MKIYLAGPMSGLPQFNFPAFQKYAAALRSAGFDVVSPAELDEEESAAAAMASADGDPATAHRTWGDFLSRDVKLIADQGIEGIILMPGWQKSRGARLEASVGMIMKLKFFRLLGDSTEPFECPDHIIASGLFDANVGRSNASPN